MRIGCKPYETQYFLHSRNICPNKFIDFVQIFLLKITIVVQGEFVPRRKKFRGFAPSFYKKYGFECNSQLRLSFFPLA
jgi:hypothetical protein